MSTKNTTKTAPATAAQITSYNELVKAANKADPTLKAKAIKTWPHGAKALQARIDSLADVVGAVPAKANAKAPKAKATAKDAKAKDAKPAKDANAISVADLARATGQNPKVVRARLRRMYAKDAKNLPTPTDGWTFNKKDEARVMALVKPATE